MPEAKTYTFHEDAGHGWLEVDRKELRTLGIQHRITSFSYQKGSKVFLEEDCDASTFIRAKEAKGEKVKLDWVRDGDDSPIRKYKRFSADVEL